MIEWAFFDVGNVLFHDLAQVCCSYHCVHRELQKLDDQLRFEDLLRIREERTRPGGGWVLDGILRERLPEEHVRRFYHDLHCRLMADYDRNNLLCDGALGVLESLRPRFRLGIIANQPTECRPSLARRGLLDLFDVVAISDELNLRKPDMRLYQWALEQAGCEPRRAVMIGDRRDNDVLPARQVGMRTIQLVWPDDVCPWRPDDPSSRLFLESLRRVPLFPDPADAPAADVTIRSLAEVVAAIHTIAHGSRATPESYALPPRVAGAGGFAKPR